MTSGPSENGAASSGHGGMGSKLPAGEDSSVNAAAGGSRPVHVSKINHASGVTWATSAADIHCNYSDHRMEIHDSTQQVLVPVSWLLTQARGDGSSYEGRCKIGADEKELRPLLDYLLLLLENER